MSDKKQILLTEQQIEEKLNKVDKPLVGTKLILGDTELSEENLIALLALLDENLVSHGE